MYRSRSRSRRSRRSRSNSQSQVLSLHQSYDRNKYHKFLTAILDYYLVIKDEILETKENKKNIDDALSDITEELDDIKDTETLLFSYDKIYTSLMKILDACKNLIDYVKNFQENQRGILVNIYKNIIYFQTYIMILLQNIYTKFKEILEDDITHIVNQTRPYVYIGKMYSLLNYGRNLLSGPSALQLGGTITEYYDKIVKYISYALYYMRLLYDEFNNLNNLLIAKKVISSDYEIIAKNIKKYIVMINIYCLRLEILSLNDSKNTSANSIFAYDIDEHSKFEIQALLVDNLDKIKSTFQKPDTVQDLFIDYNSDIKEIENVTKITNIYNEEELKRICELYSKGKIQFDKITEHSIRTP